MNYIHFDGMRRVGMNYIHFDGMNWPSLEGLDDLEWSLRHAGLEPTRMQMATLIAAYRSLVQATQKKRNYVCREIEKHSKLARLQRVKP